MTELTGTSLTFKPQTSQQQVSDVLLRQNQPQPAQPQITEAPAPEQKSDFIRVSSSLGKAASSGRLSREEALEIYREIATLL